MPLLIDGYNLLRSIQKTSDDFNAITDFQMCLIIDRYCGLAGEKGRIIFDGIGPRDKSGFDGIRNLEVFFTGVGVEADKVIEDMIRSNTAPKSLTVVSTDLRIKRAARVRRAVPVKSEVFWGRIEKFLSRRGRPREPKEKRTGISEGETEQWMRFFELD